jgi:transcriptional regulator with XRE-family HTH domain
MGFSPEGFASRIGPAVSARTIRRWEAGQHTPHIRHLEAIADAFNVDIGLFFEPSNPERSSRVRKGRPRKDPSQMELLPGAPDDGSSESS